jgi:hypothetical protein
MARPVTSRLAPLQERADRVETLAAMGAQFSEQNQQGLWGLAAKVDSIDGRIASLCDQLDVDMQVMGEFTRITERLSRRLAAQADELARRAEHLGHDAGRAYDVQLVAAPFVFRVLADLAPAGRVLIAEATPDTLGPSLASLGYRVTAVDARPYPFTHPGLDAVGSAADVWAGPDEPFDAIVHLPAPALSAALVGRLASWLQPSGRLVVAAPFEIEVPDGTPNDATDGVEPGADDAGTAALDAALDAMTVVERAVYRSVGPGAWEPVPPGDEPPKWGPGDRGVTLVVATPA